MKQYYRVAGHVFSVEAEDTVFALMDQYRPFLTDETSNLIFSLNIQAIPTLVDYQLDIEQKEEEQIIRCGHTSDGRDVLETYMGKRLGGQLVCTGQFSIGHLSLGEDGLTLFAVNFALMLMYALATANRNTVIFHSSVVCWQDHAYMFLGKSGTGKSTHSKLWLRYIAGTELVNDDNPVVRILDNGDMRVYGSPWSGKTPCYRDVSFPIGGIVQLKQAPFNKIRKLRGIEAYSYLIQSISGMRWNRQQADGIHQTENLLASRLPVWFLECLPDQAAAELSHSTIRQ